MYLQLSQGDDEENINRCGKTNVGKTLSAEGFELEAVFFFF